MLDHSPGTCLTIEKVIEPLALRRLDIRRWRAIAPCALAYSAFADDQHAFNLIGICQAIAELKFLLHFQTHGKKYVVEPEHRPFVMSFQKPGA